MTEACLLEIPIGSRLPGEYCCRLDYGDSCCYAATRTQPFINTIRKTFDVYARRVGGKRPFEGSRC